MKFLNKDRVLCIGAHPDDVEYGMAGTFKKCYNTMFEVVVMSGGGDFDNTTTDADRKNENESIWGMFDRNVKGIVSDKFVKSQDEDSMVNFIETNFQFFDLIATTPPNYFVGLSEMEYRFKKEVLSEFESQQDAPYFSERTIDNFHHNFLCSKRGMDIVESYRIVESFQK